MPRPFYIIGRNPNQVKHTDGVASAEDYLKAGANALEPDIHYAQINPREPYRYYISHGAPTFADPTLEQYLAELVGLLQDNPDYKLALIAFDLKPENESAPMYMYDINELYSIIREYFSRYCPGTMILTTVGHPEGVTFLQGVRGHQRISEAVGVDEHVHPDDVIHAFHPLNLNFSYACGISILESPEILDKIVGPLSFLLWQRMELPHGEVRADFRSCMHGPFQTPMI